MVVFEDGLPRKSEYRHFVVRGEEGRGARDDTEAMYEVLTRRFRRYLIDAAGSPDDLQDPDDGAPRTGEVDPEPQGRRPKRFAYPPNLVVVDGGQPQVAAAQRALADLGVVDIAIVGLAKRLEEVWLPGRSSRWCCRAPRRASTCCSACVTRPTGSRSRTTASGVPRA